MARYGWNYNRPDWNQGYDYDRPGAYAGGRFGGGYYGAGERPGGGSYGADYGAGYGAGAGGYYGGGRTYQRGFDIGPTWGGGSDVGYRTDRVRGYGYDRDLGDRLREGWRGVQRGARRAFRGGQGRDWGDRLQEGWNEARRGVRRAVGGEPQGGHTGYGRGYDRGW